VLTYFVIVELEARENAALQKAAKEKTAVKEQQTKNAAKQLEQEVLLSCIVCVFWSLCNFFSNCYPFILIKMFLFSFSIPLIFQYLLFVL